MKLIIIASIPYMFILNRPHLNTRTLYNEIRICDEEGNSTNSLYQRSLIIDGSHQWGTHDHLQQLCRKKGFARVWNILSYNLLLPSVPNNQSCNGLHYFGFKMVLIYIYFKDLQLYTPLQGMLAERDLFSWVFPSFLLLIFLEEKN